MDIVQFDFSGRGQPDIAETVYDSLHGFLLPACQLPWAGCIFQPGDPACEAYEQMQAAYARLRLRLGHADEDPDAEEMIDALLRYGKIMALEMFRRGVEYQKILEKPAENTNTGRLP